jgi:hypothetical protein
MMSRAIFTLGAKHMNLGSATKTYHQFQTEYLPLLSVKKTAFCFKCSERKISQVGGPKIEDVYQ